MKIKSEKRNSESGESPKFSKKLLDEIVYPYVIEFLEPGATMVHTGKWFEDGDELHIIFKCSDEEGIYLTDEGHTMMWLSYSIEDGVLATKEFINNEVKPLLDQIGGKNKVVYEDGCICMRFKEEEGFAEAITRFSQALTLVANLWTLKDKVKEE